jgi:hypothetical protein
MIFNRLQSNVLVAILLTIFTLCQTYAREKHMLPFDELPSIKQLPDPFLRTDGIKTRDKKEWESQRQYLKNLIQQYEYGHLPPAPGNVHGKVISSIPSTDFDAIEKEIALTMGPRDTIHAIVTLTIPSGKGPFPVILVGDQCWGRVKPEIVHAVLQRGYILAEFDRTAFASDSNDRSGGIYAAYPNTDCGALGAWAWGYERVIDYLLTLPITDKKHIAITGHSRGGKATLLAGAMDDRVALTAPNNSGCGGAGCFRFLFGHCEDISAITKNFPYWFQSQFSQFAGKEDKLPFDQHTVKALVAPRALLSTEGLEDAWSNPQGTQVTFEAARVVYRFLGAENKIGIVFRPGGHEHGLADWEALLDYADIQFFGRKVNRSFDDLPFPTETRSYFTWNAPK